MARSAAEPTACSTPTTSRSTGRTASGSIAVTACRAPSFRRSTLWVRSNLKVKAESVAPGDWDMANNAVERLIEVSDLTPEYDVASVEATVVDINKTGFRQTGRLVNSATTGYDWLW